MNKKKVKLKNGKMGYVFSIDKLEDADMDMEGFCRLCGNSQPAEPDAVKYTCESCNQPAVFGAAEFILRGWYFTD